MGKPAPESFGKTHDIRLQTKVLEAKPSARTAKSGLDLVDDQQCTPFTAETLGPFQKLRRFTHVDAAFALDHFHHNRADLVGESRLQCDPTGCRAHV